LIEIINTLGPSFIGLFGVFIGSIISMLVQRQKSINDLHKQIYIEYLTAYTNIKADSSNFENIIHYRESANKAALLASKKVIEDIKLLHKNCLFDGVLNDKSPEERAKLFEEHERKIINDMRKDLRIRGCVPEDWHIFNIYNNN